jgi:acyl CoA:acetate/3-ketoacid CoA transferase alpha subunit
LLQGRTGAGLTLFRARDTETRLADSRAALIVALAAAATACGAVSASSVIGDAEDAVARAHSREGEKYALYETTLADLYLVKAREEQGHAHYSDAEDLADASRKYADQAAKKAADRHAADAAAAVPTATIQRAQPPAPQPPAVQPEGAKTVVPGAPASAPAPKPGDGHQ